VDDDAQVAVIGVAYDDGTTTPTVSPALTR
jgi:hypothetical protein